MLCLSKNRETFIISLLEKLMKLEKSRKSSQGLTNDTLTTLYTSALLFTLAKDSDLRPNKNEWERHNSLEPINKHPLSNQIVNIIF